MKFRYEKETEQLIVSEASRIEYHQMQLWLTRKVKGWKYHPAVKIGVWDGNMTFFKNGRINLGLWKEAMRGCKEIEMPFTLDNKLDFPINRDVTLEKVQDFCSEFFKTHKVKVNGQWIPFMPYDHQIEAAYKILKNRYCMAEVATSGGKSLIISIVMFYTLNNIAEDAKFLIIVPSITLVTQFYDNILEYNYGINNLLEMKEKNTDKLSTGHNPCVVRVEEVMSDRPRKFSGAENPNVYIGTYQSLEKWPKEFFEKFHTIATDEAHGAKAKTITKILEYTFGHAYCRFGVSGTFPLEDTCEILTIQSVLGPKITEVSADELKKKGIITPMEIRVVVMNHNHLEFNERLKLVRKSGDGKAAFDFEKTFIHQSDKRLDFIKTLVQKCTNNTLLLFHTIENGQRIYDKLKREIDDKDFFYIDGEVSGRYTAHIHTRHLEYQWGWCQNVWICSTTNGNCVSYLITSTTIQNSDGRSQISPATVDQCSNDSTCATGIVNGGIGSACVTLAWIYLVQCSDTAAYHNSLISSSLAGITNWRLHHHCWGAGVALALIQHADLRNITELWSNSGNQAHKRTLNDVLDVNCVNLHATSSCLHCSTIEVRTDAICQNSNVTKASVAVGDGAGSAIFHPSAHCAADGED